MRIYMHWDMEGVSGIHTREHVWYWEVGVRKHVAEEGRQLLIADVNSAVAAALEAGADDIIVTDTHHGGGNIILDQMLSDARVTYNEKATGYSNKEYRWMPGLDESVDGLMLLGHHAKAGTEGAFLPHTQNIQWTDFKINDQSVGEIGIEACFAGHWGIPVALVQGDEAACREAEELFDCITTVSVKRAIDPNVCSGLEPEAARRLTAQKVAEAIEEIRRDRCKPYKPKLPMTATIRMKEAGKAEVAAKKQRVERIDEHTVQGTVEQLCDVLKWILGLGLNMPSPKP
ncbi:MAG: M55 family metallopeptidase [Candidatus Bathyarchaeota archaeon]|nr:M55 family metallopeptidase [Candidatus Bathyarchaeota archaeon]MDH5688779.1 M55 family metallopeptidase [Candidatus Bathyarchaeota archaeon]